MIPIRLRSKSNASVVGCASGLNTGVLRQTVRPGGLTSVPRVLPSPLRSTRHVIVAAEGGKNMPRGMGNKGRGGSGGGRGGGRGKDRAAPKPSFLTPPIEHRLSTILTNWERLPKPLWQTFCGSCSGVWKGSYVALSPVDGDPEPLVLDGKDKVRMLKTIVTETRLQDPELGDILQRSVKRVSPQAPPHAEPVAEFSEAFRADDLGLVTFEDGSYSSGPLRLGVPVSLDELDFTVARNPMTKRPDEEPDLGIDYEIDLADVVINQEEDEDEEEDEKEEEGVEGVEAAAGAEGEGADDEEEEEEDDPIFLDAEDPDDPRETAVIEQCVALWGDTRVRVELTLSAKGGGAVELDVVLLRVTAHYEEWTGPTGTSAAADPTSTNAATPLTPKELESGVVRAVRLRNDAEYKLLPVMRPKDLQGSWRVFSIVGTPIEELTADGPKTTMAFNSIETEEKWVPRGSTPEELGEDGATMWLPGKVLVGISMTPEKDSNGRTPRQQPGTPLEVPRKFLVSLGWMYEDGRMTMIEREYNSSGALKEVRMKSGVFGKWSGGRG